MEPVSVQVITYTPTVFYHCQHCELTFKQAGFGDSIHREQAREALPDDLREEFHEVAAWIQGVSREYGDRVEVRLIDAASIEGVWKSFRHGIRRYPAVVVDGKEKVIGGDFDAASAIIAGRAASPHERPGHEQKGGRSGAT